MPDIVAHNMMGRKVLKNLDTEISSLIDYSIFQFSIIGPDPFHYYRFYMPCFRKGINTRSSIMHEKNAGEFLLELAKNSQSQEMFSFLSGFLCHYALDSTAHPFINKAANNDGHMHTAIEHKLDVLELERQEKQLQDIMNLFPAYPNLTEAKAAVRKIYGWDDNYFKTSYCHMKIYHWLAKDQYGLLLTVLKTINKSRAVHSYQTRLADEINLNPFWELENEAVQLGAELITSAYRFRTGEIGEYELKAIIGNKTYSGEDAIISDGD